MRGASHRKVERKGERGRKAPALSFKCQGDIVDDEWYLKQLTPGLRDSATKLLLSHPEGVLPLSCLILSAGGSNLPSPSLAVED